MNLLRFFLLFHLYQKKYLVDRIKAKVSVRNKEKPAQINVNIH